MTPDDAALEARVLALTREWGPRVYGIAKRYARGRDDTEDLLQEIWTRVIETLATKPPDAAPGAWLTVLAVNVGREWSRHRYQWSDFKEKGLRFFGIEQQLVRDGRDEPRISTAAEDRVWRAVEALPALQREVVILRVFEEMSTIQAAKVIERSEGTVKSSLKRALDTLRKKLADLEDLWANGEL